MRILAFGLFLLVLLGGAWAALWFYAAHEAGQEFEAWLKSEDQHGRAWTCPDRSIGGFPLAVTLHCAHPTFTGQAFDQTVKGSVAAFSAEASVTHPQRLVIDVQSPLSYKTSDGAADLKATWSSLAIDLDGLPAVQTVSLHGTDLAIDGDFGQSGRQGGKAPRLDAIFAMHGQDTEPTLDFTIAVRGSAIPPLDALLGGEAPVDIDLAGRLDHAVVGQVRTPEEALETWREAGGRIDLAQSRLSRGDSSVSGAGTLRLDEDHRPQGRLNASFVGLEPVLKRYGISGNVAAAGSLIGALLGGEPPQATPSTPGALTLPISFQNGRLGIGPFRTPIELPPLY